MSTSKAPHLDPELKLDAEPEEKSGPSAESVVEKDEPSAASRLKSEELAHSSSADLERSSAEVRESVVEHLQKVHSHPLQVESLKADSVHPAGEAEGAQEDAEAEGDAVESALAEELAQLQGGASGGGGGKGQARGVFVQAFVLDPFRRAITHPVFWIEGTARFIRDRTVLASAVVFFGLYLAFGARWGWVTPPDGLSRDGLMVAGSVVVLSALWLFETIPLAATALLPMVLFPLLGIQSARDVANAYGNSTILLLMGSFFLARGVETWEVPNLLAAKVGAWAKGSPLRLVYGLMGATAVLSAWISNTAATLIMVTVAMAAARRAELAEPGRPKEVQRFKFALLLGIAYSANIGGIATPIGSPPNVIMLALYQQLFPDAQPLSFVPWMMVALPVVLITLPLAAIVLTKVVFRFPADLQTGDFSRDTALSFSKLPVGARRALGIFALTALMWVFRVDIDLGFLTIPGWSELLGIAPMVDDAVVAILGATAMFLMPAGRLEDSLAAQARPLEQNRKISREPQALWLVRALRHSFQNRVLSWEAASDIPWHLLVLFGGGLALAGAFEASGLSVWIGQQLGDMAGAPGWLVVLAVSFAMALLSEFTSNTASVAVITPVLAAASESLGIHPLLLMWPATLSSAACFLMPIATPPNAIAAGAGNISVATMVRAGLPMKFIMVPVVALVTWFWGAVVMGIPQ